MSEWMNFFAPEQTGRGEAATEPAPALRFIEEQFKQLYRSVGTVAGDKLPPLELTATPPSKAERQPDSFDSIAAAVRLLPAKLTMENPVLVTLALRGLLPPDTPSEIKEFTKKIVGLKKTNADFQVKLKEPTQLGELPLHAAKEVSFRFVQHKDKSAFSVEDLKGLTVKVPLPEDILNRLGIKPETAITKLVAGSPDANGNRRITVETDGSIKSVSFEVGPDNKPVTKNNRGTEYTEVNVQFKVGEGQIACKFYTHIDKNSSKLQIDQVDLKGTAGSKAEVLKALGIPEEIAVAGEKVTSVVAHNGGFKIYSDGATETTVRGLKVRLEEMMFVKSASKDLGAGKLEHDIEVYGFSITGFDFKGDRWEKLGSSTLNYLGKDNGLPVRIHKLSISDRDNNQSLITIKETTGALIAAQFLVDKSNGNLLDGKLLVSNPLNKVLPGKPAAPVEISIKNGVVAKPQEVVFSALDGVPLLRYNPLYSGAKWTYRLSDSPAGQMIKNEVKHTAQVVVNKLDSAGKVLGQQLDTGAKKAGAKLSQGASWAGSTLSSGVSWIRRKF